MSTMSQKEFKMYQKASTSLQSRSSHNSHGREENEEILIEEPLNIPTEPKLVSIHLQDVTVNSPGRRFLGCYNFKTKNCEFFKWVDREMKPCERVYEFYLKIQDQKREVKMLTKKALFHEIKNEQLEKMNYKLMKMLKKMEQDRDVSMKKRCVWRIVLVLIFTLSFIVRVF